MKNTNAGSLHSHRSSSGRAESKITTVLEMLGSLTILIVCIGIAVANLPGFLLGLWIMWHDRDKTGNAAPLSVLKESQIVTVRGGMEWTNCIDLLVETNGRSKFITIPIEVGNRGRQKFKMGWDYEYKDGKLVSKPPLRN